MPQAAVPVAAAVAGGIASAGAAKLFSGGGKKIPNPSANLPTSLITPGFSLTRTGNKTLSLERTGSADFLTQLGLLNEDQAKKIGGLLESVRPGFSDLRRTRLQGLANTRRRTIGDLRDNLARRRVLGSSFAQDAITRANLDFQQREDEIRSTSFLQELELTNKLIQQQADTLRSTVLTGIEQGNFEAQLAANFANRTQAVLGQIGQFQAQLAAQAQAGMGALLQPAISAIGSGVSNAVTGYFNQPTQTPLYNPSQINNYGY